MHLVWYCFEKHAKIWPQTVFFIIDREAGETICLVASIHPSVRQVSYTLKIHYRVFISRSIQNGWAFKRVVVLTGCAIAIDNTFNIKNKRIDVLKICRDWSFNYTPKN